MLVKSTAACLLALVLLSSLCEAHRPVPGTWTNSGNPPGVSRKTRDVSTDKAGVVWEGVVAFGPIDVGVKEKK